MSATKEAAEVAAKIDDTCCVKPPVYCQHEYGIYREQAALLIDQHVAALRERAEAAEAWKESAMTVEKSWDVQAVGRLLGLPLGSAIRAGIEPGITALRTRAALADELAELLAQCEIDLVWELTLKFGEDRAKRDITVKKIGPLLTRYAATHPANATNRGGTNL